MKIKVVILDSDAQYLERLGATFGMKYVQKLQLFSCTSLKKALEIINEKRVDILLATEDFDVDYKALPKRCGFGYLVEDHDTESINDQFVVCKFQKAEQIYKQILGLYSEHSSSITGRVTNGENGNLVIFESPCGGVGTSSMASAFALNLAMTGRKVLYLNLEKFGTADNFFSAEGTLGMSDIVYALKSRKANLPMKLESCLKQDPCGVYFISGSAVALDNMELKHEEIWELIEAINMSSDFEYIILDTDFSLEKDAVKLIQKSNALIMVSDGSEPANTKIRRAVDSMIKMEQNLDDPITVRTHLIYNRFSNKTGMGMDDINIDILGGAPRYEHATIHQVVLQLSQMNLFDRIINQEMY